MESINPDFHAETENSNLTESMTDCNVMKYFNWNISTRALAFRL